jgi:hypothetical protein
MLIQNRSKRTYELKVGTIKPLGVIDVPADKVEDVLKSGCGELVVLEVAKANEPEEEAPKPVKKAVKRS